jgi:hypothetical protein
MSITDDPLLEAMIDQTLTDSFPASDPPAWTLGRESQPNAVPSAPEHENTSEEAKSHWREATAAKRRAL